MTRTDVINELVEKFSLQREWVNQFQTKDLEEMLKDLKSKTKA